MNSTLSYLYSLALFMYRKSLFAAVLQSGMTLQRLIKDSGPLAPSVFLYVKLKGEESVLSCDDGLGT